MKLSHKLIVGLFTGIILIWISGYLVIDMSRKKMEEHFFGNTKMVSEAILHELEREIYNRIEIFQEYCRDTVLQKTIQMSNIYFEGMDNRKSYIAMKDQEWTHVLKGEVTPFMENLMHNELSRELKEKTEYYEKKYGYKVFSEIFVTNRYGVNVAQTGKTTDYRQDDEKWWQIAEKDGFYLGYVTFDESAGDYALDLGIRIDDEKGNFIGIMKVLLSLNQITTALNGLEDYLKNELHENKFHLRLITKDKKLIYSSVEGEKFLQDAPAFFDPEALKKEVGIRSSYTVNNGILSVYVHSKELGGLIDPDWTLIADYDMEKVFAPVVLLRNRLYTIYIVVTLILIIAGIFISARVTKSVMRLRDAAIRIGKGDLDTIVEVNTRDEIGDLAKAFGQMKGDLKATNAVRAKLTEDLQENEERLKSVLETASDAIVSFDNTGKIIFWNTAAEKIFGHSADEAAGMPITSCLSGLFQDFFHKNFAHDTVWGNIEMADKVYEFSGLKKDGREFPAEISIAVWRKKGETFFTAIIRDITERKRTENLIHLQFNRLKILNSIDKAVNSSIDLHSTLDIFADQVTVQLGIDAATILLMNRHTQRLEHVISKGFRSNALKFTHLRLGESNAGRAAMERRIMGISDLVREPDGFTRSKLFPDERFVSYFAVPLIVKGEVKGVLELFHRSLLKVDQEWLNFLETIADQAAIAIDHTSLFDALQLSRNELMRAYDSTIVGWSNALDMKDKETEGHSLRVTDITTRIAQQLGIKGEALVHIRRGALLHDIGKMGIPDSILLKPGKLTEEEWAIMKRHPLYAFEMLGAIDYLKPALDIPLYHHEKWDGTGYPYCLRGEDIPRGARMFAVVDVWDALTTDRPYRPAWLKEKTLGYIRSQSGIHFDPEIVEVFLSMATTSFLHPQPQDEVSRPLRTNPSLSPS